jgi:hypothetical protein
MLVRCLYASRTAQPPSAPLITTLLAQCAKNNPRLGVTGVLCYTNDVFLQVLEGGRDEVCELVNAITRDTRHTNVRILLFEEIKQRRYARWAMGQIDPSRVTQELLLRYSVKPVLNPFDAPGQTTMDLLDELVTTGGVLAARP